MRIQIDAYNPEWPLQFEREAVRIREALGAQALLVEHAGSTSVPGLPAKPIIDIVLAVTNSADESAYAAALEQAGYSLKIREPHWHEHRLFKGERHDVNLHVFSQGCPEIERMLAFRDWLRTNESDRESYSRVKRDLAEREWECTQEYADAKTQVVTAILSRVSMPGR